MIKKLLFTALTLGALHISAQSFSGMYHFTGVMSGTASTGTLDPTPTPTATGLTFGSFSAVGTPSNPSAGGVFAFDTWGVGATNGNNVTFTGSIDPAKYMMVTLTPAANATVNFTSITFNISRSGTGPRHWAVRGSLDSYSTNLTATIAPTNTNISVTTGDVFFWDLDTYTVTGGKQERGSTINLGTPYSNQTNPVSFRFYPWDAEGTAGTFRLDTVIFNGTNVIMAGINKVTTDLNSKFSLYPNPSNDGVVTIEAKNNFNKIEVLNILGAVVAQQNGVLADKIKLDLSTLPQGTYFVRISTGDKVSTEKLILSR